MKEKTVITHWRLINSNMGCIEMYLIAERDGVKVKINSNMGCIEMYLIAERDGVKVKINSNMGCIEM